ncbi:hypothetical protein FQA47_001422 [Oryzias melastigma]|uniref:Crumbs homolog 3b n=1 Tax=Oryzias melastigma TaxID=30732 RepID=A0A834FRD2_ORYME|nr:hypothetical protein FQA47_001422 [Oryzias melastigma]
MITCSEPEKQVRQVTPHACLRLRGRECKQRKGPRETVSARAPASTDVLETPRFGGRGVSATQLNVAPGEEEEDFLVSMVLASPSSPAFTCAAASVLTLTLLLLLCIIRKKRKMEGTYQPSAEEKKQSRPERPGLPLPKEERLI